MVAITKDRGDAQSSQPIGRPAEMNEMERLGETKAENAREEKTHAAHALKIKTSTNISRRSIPKSC